MSGPSSTAVRSFRPTQRATSPRRRPPARRSRRLRRPLAVAVFVAVLAALCVDLASPLVNRAIRDLSLPLKDSSIIVTQARAKHLDPALVAAVIDAETGFDARTSPAGALGLMQVEPATAKILARQSGATTFSVDDLGTPAVNIAYGSYYLRQLMNNFNGDETAALAAYNGGETNVDRWIARAHSAGHSFGLADIPFPQTRAYVAKVLHLQAEYRAKYSHQLGY